MRITVAKKKINMSQIIHQHINCIILTITIRNFPHRAKGADQFSLSGVVHVDTPAQTIHNTLRRSLFKVPIDGDMDQKRYATRR